METFNRLRDEKRFAEVIAAVPYARLMGVECGEDAAGELLFSLPFYERNVGTPPCRRCTAA